MTLPVACQQQESKRFPVPEVPEHTETPETAANTAPHGEAVGAVVEAVDAVVEAVAAETAAPAVEGTHEAAQAHEAAPVATAAPDAAPNHAEASPAPAPAPVDPIDALLAEPPLPAPPTEVRADNQFAEIKPLERARAAVKPEKPVVTPRVSLFPLSGKKDWEKPVIAAATALGFGMDTSRRNQVLLWDPAAITECKGTKGRVRMVDGHAVGLQTVGKEMRTIRIEPRRVFFEGENPKPTRKRENQLFRHAPLPPVARADARVASCFALAEKLAPHSPRLSATPLQTAEFFTNLHDGTHAVVGGGEKVRAQTEAIRQGVRKHGFRHVPNGFALYICARDVRHPVIRDAALEYERAGMDSAQPVQVVIIGADAVTNRINQIRRGVQVKYSAAMTLIASPAEPGEPLPPELDVIVKGMTELKLPFLVFDPLREEKRWAAHDQLLTLLGGSGGHPWDLALPWPEHLKNPVTIGIDIGHPAERSRSSPVVTLVDASGRLISCWRGKPPAEDTPPAPNAPRKPEGAANNEASEAALLEAWQTDVLTSSMTWAKDKLDKLYPDGWSPLVLRDGRMFEGENVHTYETLLGRPCTLAEVARHNMPVMEFNGACARAGTAVRLLGDQSIYVLTTRNPNPEHLTAPLRLTIRRDRLALGPDLLAGIVTGLCYAPTLGYLRPRLPAPLYWADGVATEDDMRFRGVPREGPAPF
jgi:hypothetical protein